MADVVCTNPDCPEQSVVCTNLFDTPVDDIVCGTCGEPVDAAEADA